MAIFVGTMQQTLSIAIMQVPMSVAITQFLRFYCNYVGGTFATFMLVDLVIAIMLVTLSVAICS